MDSKDALELWLVRHGQSTWNAVQRIQGQQDAPLSDLGQQQAKALQPRLHNHTFDAIYSSDLSRAFDTASFALPDTNIKKDERLRELSFGIFEGKMRSELSETEKAEFSMWRKDRVSDGPALYEKYGIEPDEVLLARFNGFLSELPKTGKVIVFSHGGLIRLVLHQCLGKTAGFQRTFNISNTSINRIQIFADGEFVRILSVNDSAHTESL